MTRVARPSAPDSPYVPPLLRASSEETKKRPVPLRGRRGRAYYRGDVVRTFQSRRIRRGAEESNSVAIDCATVAGAMATRHSPVPFGHGVEPLREHGRHARRRSMVRL